MVTATGKVKQIDPSATDGSQYASGVLMQAVDAALAERLDGLMVARHAIVADHAVSRGGHTDKCAVGVGHGVGSVATVEVVCAAAADESVVARATAEGVRERTADQSIVTRSADDVLEVGADRVALANGSVVASDGV